MTLYDLTHKKTAFIVIVLVFLVYIQESHEENEIYLTNYIYRSESTNELNQKQEHQLLSNTLHSLQSCPDAIFSCFLVLSSVPPRKEPSRILLLSRNPLKHRSTISTFISYKSFNFYTLSV